MLAAMQQQPGRLRTRDVRRRFDRASADFHDADFVHRQTFAGLLDRLAPITAKPGVILDLGCAKGTGSRALASRYPGARVIAVDLSLPMLRFAKEKWWQRRRIRPVQGDANALPLKSQGVDLAFANLLLPWINDLPACLTEVSRVLARDGLFTFSALGPDSLKELREAWGTIDQDWHVNPFPDMHDLGDALVRAGLSDPVLDVDRISIRYDELSKLYRDLSCSGARNSLEHRRRSMTGKAGFRRMEESLSQASAGNGFTLTLEIVYGHAWSVGERPPPGEFRLDPADIGGRRRSA